MLLQCRRFDSCGNHSFHPPSHLSRAPPAPKHLKSLYTSTSSSPWLLRAHVGASVVLLRAPASNINASVSTTPRTPPLMGDPLLSGGTSEKLLPRHSCFRLCPAQFWSPWVHESQSQMHGHCDRIKSPLKGVALLTSFGEVDFGEGCG